MERRRELLCSRWPWSEVAAADNRGRNRRCTPLLSPDRTGQDIREIILTTNWQTRHPAISGAPLSAFLVPNKRHLQCRADNGHAAYFARSSGGAERHRRKEQK